MIYSNGNKSEIMKWRHYLIAGTILISTIIGQPSYAKQIDITCTCETKSSPWYFTLDWAGKTIRAYNSNAILSNISWGDAGVEFDSSTTFGDSRLNAHVVISHKLSRWRYEGHFVGGSLNGGTSSDHGSCWIGILEPIFEVD